MSLIDEVESFLMDDHTPDVAGEDGELQVPSNDDYDVEGAYEQELYPLIQQVLEVCEENEIPAQFAVFPKADRGVVTVRQHLCCVDKRPEVATASLIYTLPHSLSHVVMRCLTSPVVMMEAMANSDNDLPFFDRVEVFNQELVPLLEKIGRLCDDYKIPIQWGMCVGYVKENDSTVGLHHRNYHSEIPFSPCQITVAQACYGTLPFNLLEDLLELKSLAS